MDPSRQLEAMLGPYRVLDLTDEKGLIAGKLMGDLGADVIKIEPPGGDPSRGIGPFYHDDPHPERSLYWMAFNLNKRGITLNLETKDGRALFRRLVATADFVVECFPPGYLKGLGLGYPELREVNPRIIVASITPFGQTGPYSDFKTTDLINEAMGGIMYVSGDEDRAPVRISFPVSYCHAGAEAAAASAMAHYYRELTGRGQHIDVSIQQCVIWTLLNSTVTWDLVHQDVMRTAGARINAQTGLRAYTVWACKDGYVSFGLTRATRRGIGMDAMLEWMDREGMASPKFKAFDWAALDMHTIGQERYEALVNEVRAFLKTKPMQELYQYAVEHRVVLAPVVTAKELLESPQLKARDYYVSLEHPELGEGARIIYPSAFVKMSAWAPHTWRRAPHVGEHNSEIYEDELGLSTEEMLALSQAGVI